MLFDAFRGWKDRVRPMTLNMRERVGAMHCGAECNPELAEGEPPAGWEVGTGESKKEQRAGSRKRGA